MRIRVVFALLLVALLAFSLVAAVPRRGGHAKAAQAHARRPHANARAAHQARKGINAHASPAAAAIGQAKKARHTEKTQWRNVNVAGDAPGCATTLNTASSPFWKGAAQYANVDFLPADITGCGYGQTAGNYAGAQADASSTTTSWSYDTCYVDCKTGFTNFGYSTLYCDQATSDMDTGYYPFCISFDAAKVSPADVANGDTVTVSITSSFNDVDFTVDVDCEGATLTPPTALSFLAARAQPAEDTLSVSFTFTNDGSGYRTCSFSSSELSLFADQTVSASLQVDMAATTPPSVTVTVPGSTTIADGGSATYELTFADSPTIDATVVDQIYFDCEDAALSTVSGGSTPSCSLVSATAATCVVTFGAVSSASVVTCTPDVSNVNFNGLTITGTIPTINLAAHPASVSLSTSGSTSTAGSIAQGSTLSIALAVSDLASASAATTVTFTCTPSVGPAAFTLVFDIASGANQVTASPKTATVPAHTAGYTLTCVESASGDASVVAAAVSNLVYTVSAPVVVSLSTSGTSPASGTVAQGSIVSVALAVSNLASASTATTITFTCTPSVGPAAFTVVFNIAASASSVTSSPKTFTVPAHTAGYTLTCVKSATGDAGVVSASVSNLVYTVSAPVLKPAFALTSNKATGSTLNASTVITFTATFTAGDIVTSITVPTNVTVSCAPAAGAAVTGWGTIAAAATTVSVAVTTPVFVYTTDVTCTISAVTSTVLSTGDSSTKSGSFIYHITGTSGGPPPTTGTSSSSSSTGDHPGSSGSFDAAAAGPACSALALLIAAVAAMMAL